MHLSEALDIQGRLTLRTTTIDHQLIDQITANNSIVLSGRRFVAQRFLNIQVEPIAYIAVGTGTDPVDVSNTKLSKELFRKPIERIDPGRDLQTIEVTNPADPTSKNSRVKVLLSTNLEPEEANGALTEAALFTQSDIMYNRVTFAPVNKSSKFRLTLLWEILF